MSKKKVKIGRVTGFGIIILVASVFIVLTIPALFVDRIPLVLTLDCEGAKSYGLLYRGLPSGLAQVSMRGYLIPENKTIIVDFPIARYPLFGHQDVERGVEIHFIDKYGEFIEIRFVKIDYIKWG